MARLTTKRRVRACLPPLTLALLLAACGGGGGEAPSQPSQAQADPGATGASAQAGSLPGVRLVSALTSVPTAAADSGLEPRPPQVIDAALAGERVVKAVSTLDGGGHAVAWMAHGPRVPGVAWELWVQRFDTEGQRLGEPVRLDIPADVLNAQDLAVNLLPEGRIGVTFVTRRVENEVNMITEVHHWPYTLQGTIDGTARVLDAERYPRNAPLFAQLSGPIDASTGRDGSLYVSWRFQTPVSPQLVPSVRALRLAADGEPLGWIQRLDGQGVSRVYDLNLTALDEGGWVAAMERVSLVGVPYRTFTQLEVPRPLSMPLTETQAAGAFLLDLRGHGSVLFTANVDTDSGVQASPRSLYFNLRGAAQPARGLPMLPVAAVALRGGDYLTLAPDGVQLSAQRYTAAGDPVGAPFTTPATPGLVGAGLQSGGLALAWTTSAPDGRVEVVVQLITAR
ncbi:MAG: hypothetical protein QE494_17155 [Ramlibacter sp.]|uniref:hypothetical protein n=1 Tax=Ramlibacter sp. TaxID=1917967 RepID=UPI002602A683|nr:hypothetical protein [Ramlibacter sp.]MDH4378025.1 hypothetical protein [Ramlibacter sp.]